MNSRCNLKRYTWLIVALIALLPSNSFAAQLTAEYSESYRSQFLLQGAQATLKIKDQDISGQAFRPAFDYFLTKKIAAQVGYFNMPSSKDGSSLLYGFDIGLKIYPFSPAAETTTVVDGVRFKSWSAWSHYFLIAYRSRTLSLSSSQVGYGGFGLAYGVNWHLERIKFIPLGHRYFINAEAGLDTLAAVSGSDIQATIFSLGLGTAF